MEEMAVRAVEIGQLGAVMVEVKEGAEILQMVEMKLGEVKVVVEIG